MLVVKVFNSHLTIKIRKVFEIIFELKCTTTAKLGIRYVCILQVVKVALKFIKFAK